MAGTHTGQSTLVHSLATLLRNDGDGVLDGTSTLTLLASSLQELTGLFEQYLLSRSPQHGFLALPSHPADTPFLLQLQFLFDVLQKTVSLKLINPSGKRLLSALKIFPFKSLKSLELKRIPPHCLEGLRGVYSQLEVFTCSKSLSSLEELLSLCGGDLSSALPWLELHTLNFSYNSIVCLDQSLSLLNVLKSLDLSHNRIQECAEFLKPLSELEHLNLGYNSLQGAPTLSLSARAKLLTLILRNNELETINGVEQLCSLQHLDLAYNLLLEHSQLAPLSLLHCLDTLNLEGNPLCFQKTHRAGTVRHLSPKAAHLRLKLDGTPLSSSELSVLPKLGQMIGQAQTSTAVAVAPERGSRDASSGGGELSDSMEVGVTRIRRKKARSKVRVRRASISEPSDTDYEPRTRPSTEGVVLPHQKDIERLANFREQLGEDWLRYQHHLEVAPSSSTTVTSTPKPPHYGLTNGISATPPGTDLKQPTPPPLALDVPEILSPPLLSSEPTGDVVDGEGDPETESTLEWDSRSHGNTDSTLESSVIEVPGPGQGQEAGPLSPGLKGSPGTTRVETRSGDTKEEEEEEEEEDLGVDLCLPLLVGVLPDKEEDVGGGEWRSSKRMEVFLRVKQGLLLEVDMQRGRERARLELDSLAQVTVTQAAWTQGEEKKLLPAVELQFSYISTERRRRRYVMLDDDPQQALQALTDVLSRAAEENKRRTSDLCLDVCRVHLQCLRCRSEFTARGEEREEEEEEGGGGGKAWRSRGTAPPEGVVRLDGEEEEEEEKRREDGKGSNTVCPDCGSDHVVQLAGQPAPSTSTPVHRPPAHDSSGSPSSRDPANRPRSGGHSGNEEHHPDGASPTGASRSGSPALGSSTATEDPTVSSFHTAQGNSFYSGEGEGNTWANRCVSQPVSFYSTDGQSREELAGSYHYAGAAELTPPGDHGLVQAQHAERASPGGELDLLSEDYEAVDHRLKLYLDVDVFEEEEEFHSFLKMSTVKFGEPIEFPSVLVVSDRRIYFLEMMSEPHRGQPSDWLQKRDSHPITELSYLEVGLGSQSIHMEFDGGGGAYTLLVRDSARCKRFFGILTGIVREMAPKSDSKLKSISTTRLNPQHHLWSLVCEDMQTDVEDGQLQFFYLLAFLLQEDCWTPLTVLATRQTLYLLNEDHQWSKSLVDPPANESGEPCSGRVDVLETQPISCVSSVHPWASDPCRMDIKLYDEMVKQEKTWCVRSESEELLQGLLAWVRAQWEAMFGVKLTTRLRDATA